MKNAILFLLFAIPFLGLSQKANLTIAAQTSDGESIEFATATIRNAKDSSLIVGDTFDEKGKITFALKANVSYILNVSKVGYTPNNQRFMMESVDKNMELVLQQNSKLLSEATVTYREKLVRQEDDKEIVDAEPLSKLSSNAFEMLEKTPGVIVVDDNIFLGKAEAARIYINGREMKLGNNDLASILRGMPPNSVQRIELLRTPSAKFDASSSGGIINIVLKKGIKLGTSGTVNGTMARGQYSRAAAGFSINRGDELSNSYLNYQYNYRDNFESLASNRKFSTDESRLFQTAYTKFGTQTHYIAAGTDRKISDKWNIADDLIVNLDNSTTNIDNQNDVLLKGGDLFNPISKALIDNKLRKININNTITNIVKLDTNGGEWNTGFNYTFSEANTNQGYNNTGFGQAVGNGDINGQRHLFSLTSDLTKKVNKIKFETGFKIDVLQNTSNASFLLNQSRDVQRSVAYKYSENINAVYGQASRLFGKITFKTGLRVENTNMVGRQLSPRDTSFSIRRTDLFPYVYVSRDLFELFKGFMLTGNLIARRSITRPGFNVLNPAQQFTDQFFVQSGNPALRPQFTNTYEFNISFNTYPVLAVGMDDTKDVFGKVVYQDPKTKIFNETYDNIGHLRQYYTRIVGGIPPGGKYFGIVGALYNYQIYNGLYQGKPLNFERGSWTIFTYHELKCSKSTTLSANGFLRIGGVQDFYEYKNIGDLTMSLTHKFEKQNIVAILRMNDIFYNFKTNFKLQQGDVDVAGLRLTDSRRISLTVRYSFGVKMPNNRKKGEEGSIFDMVNPSKQKPTN